MASPTIAPALTRSGPDLILACATVRGLYAGGMSEKLRFTRANVGKYECFADLEIESQDAVRTKRTVRAHCKILKRGSQWWLNVRIPKESRDVTDELFGRQMLYTLKGEAVEAATMICRRGLVEKSGVFLYMRANSSEPS